MIFRDFFKTAADLIKKYKMPFFLFFAFFSLSVLYMYTHIHYQKYIHSIYLFSSDSILFIS